MAETRTLVEHFFRHEFGRLVAVLVKSIGVRHLELAEDAVQAAMMRALQTWGPRGLPDDPKAWLYRTARNHAIDTLRRQGRHDRAVSDLTQQQETSFNEPTSIDEEIGDAPLRLLFVCCHEEVPLESRIAIALKNVCGFGVGEISRALLTTEASIHKRITRARDKLRELEVTMDAPDSSGIKLRLDAVLTVVYLLFTEGCYATELPSPIRRELANQAIRLIAMLSQHPIAARPDTFALHALVCFHSARFDARTDSGGGVVLLEEQNRSTWNWAEIRNGMNWLAQSAQGDELSRYHVEAAIAWEHCRAKKFSDTDWQRISELYGMLERIAPSPINVINHAVAEAYLHGSQAGLARLNKLDPKSLPPNYPGWHSVAGELYYRAHEMSAAALHWQEALNRTANEADRRLLKGRLERARAGVFRG